MQRGDSVETGARLRYSPRDSPAPTEIRLFVEPEALNQEMNDQNSGGFGMGWHPMNLRVGRAPGETGYTGDVKRQNFSLWAKDKTEKCLPAWYGRIDAAAPIPAWYGLHRRRGSDTGVVRFVSGSDTGVVRFASTPRLRYRRGTACIDAAAPTWIVRVRRHSWHTTLNTVTNASREWAWAGHEVKDSWAYLSGKKK